MPDRLRPLAAAAAAVSHTPYSGVPSGAAVRLADGRTVWAPRLENASFPLSISALTGAWALGAVAGGVPVQAALTRPFAGHDLAFLAEAGADPAGDGPGAWRAVAGRALAAGRAFAAIWAFAVKAANRACRPVSGRARA